MNDVGEWSGDDETLVDWDARPISRFRAAANAVLGTGLGSLWIGYLVLGRSPFNAVVHLLEHVKGPWAPARLGTTAFQGTKPHSGNNVTNGP